MVLQTSHSGAGERRAGQLVIIGGNEDREDDKRVLRRFVELSGSPDPRIVVLAAGPGTGAAWRSYQRAFEGLGVRRCHLLAPESAQQADDPRLADRLLGADGVLLTGDDPTRLVEVLGGRGLHRALLAAYSELGRCIAGTGAGAAALAGQRVEGRGLAPGLGLLHGVVLDQHFSERKRLQRLLEIVAGHRELLGVGIDEDTALVVSPCGGLEVLGDGAATFIDGRGISCQRMASGGALELADVRLHLLPSGSAYGCEAESVPPALRHVMKVMTGEAGR